MTHLTNEERITALEVEVRSMEKAVQVAFTELQRRLDVLNHNHEAMTRDREQLLSREVYDISNRETRVWRDDINKFVNNWQGRVIALSAGIAGLFAILSMMIMYWTMLRTH